MTCGLGLGNHMVVLTHQNDLYSLINQIVIA